MSRPRMLSETAEVNISNVLEELDKETLCEMLLELSVLPKAVDMSMEYLRQRGIGGERRRSLSTGDLPQLANDSVRPLSAHLAAAGDRADHQFRSKYFVKTPCATCTKPFKGILKQGAECRYCRVTVHTHCIQSLSVQCLKLA
eukprot:m.18237 g.18237  ORF g.18237 m.18237 type:complete len:143 (-) comp3322_c0_seq2:201-629(-)